MSEDIAWAAGLYEGEGSCHIDKRGSAFVSLTSTDLDVVEKFQRIVGAGRIYGYDEKRKETYKRAYKWRTTKKSEAANVLAMLLPYLGERRSIKARTVLEHASKPDGRAAANNKGKGWHRPTESQNELLIQLGLKKGAVAPNVYGID